MNKNEIIKQLAKDLDMSNKKVEELFDNFQKEFFAAFSSKEDVSITVNGFGNFTSSMRSSYVGHIPGSAQKIRIPKKRSLVFKPSPVFRSQVNEKKTNS